MFSKVFEAVGFLIVFIFCGLGALVVRGMLDEQSRPTSFHCVWEETFGQTQSGICFTRKDDCEAYRANTRCTDKWPNCIVDTQGACWAQDFAWHARNDDGRDMYMPTNIMQQMSDAKVAAFSKAIPWPNGQLVRKITVQEVE